MGLGFGCLRFGLRGTVAGMSGGIVTYFSFWHLHLQLQLHIRISLTVIIPREPTNQKETARGVNREANRDRNL